MRQLKVILAVLVLAIASCRSVPSDVRQAHDLSMTESAVALGIATDILIKIEAKSTELNDASVTAAYTEWAEHMSKVTSARAVVAGYLDDSDAGADVSGPYAIGLMLLNDMNRNFATIEANWANMILDSMVEPRGVFIGKFRKDIERFKVLERKFDEWIKQFKVKE